METHNKKERQSLYVLVLIFIIFSGGIITAGYLHYKHFEKKYRTEVEQQLSAIGELKADEVVNWRQERLANAGIFYKNESFSSIARQYLENPEGAEEQDILRIWMDKILSHTQCDRVSLLDTNGSERLSVPAEAEPIDSIISKNSSKVLRLGLMTFTDFYRSGHNQKIYLNILVPIFAGPDDNLGVGVLVLRIDPEQYLYPLIKSWPIPSLTAETLLIRRQGDNVLFLNELRSKKNTALTLQSSIKNKQMPAVKAILGHKGIVEGIDYRGMPVIADVRAVPDSPWFLVTKINISEVYAPIQQRLWIIIIFAGVLLAGSTAGVGLVWRQQQSRFYKDKYKAAESLRQSEERLRLTTEAAEVGIWDWDLVTNELKWDDRSNQLLGLNAGVPQSPESFMNCIHPDDRRMVEEKIRTALEKKQDYITEYRVVDSNGNIRWLFARGHGFYDDKGQAVRMSGTAIDITERKEAERLLKESEETYRKQFEGAMDAIFVADPQSGILLDCNNAALKLVGRERSEVIGKSHAILHPPEEIEGEFNRSFKEHLSNKEGQVLETKIVTKNGVIKDVAIKASLLEIKGKKVLQGIFRNVTEQKRAAEALRDSETLYKTLYESSRDAIMLIAPPSWKFFAANTATIALFGAKDEAEFYSFPPWTLSPEYQPDGQLSSEKAKSMIEKAIKEGSNFFEWQHKRVDGKEFTATVLLNSLVLKGNKIVQATVKDITEQKLAEQHLKENESRLAVLFESNPTGLVLIERASRKIIKVNTAAAKMAGLPSERIVGHVCHGFMCPAERDHCPICDLGQQVDRSERILITADGSRLPVLKTVEMLMLGDKEYLLESFIDITERKKAEQTMLFQAAMLDATPGFVGFADAKDAHILYINPAREKMVGIGMQDDVTKFKIADVHPEWTNKLFRDKVFPAVIRDGIWTGECAFLNRDGREIPVMMVLLAHKSPSGEMERFSTISIDITERKKAEVILEQLNNDLKATISKLSSANRELAEFTRITAHDLKSPIRSIGTLAEWLVTDYADKFDEKGKELAGLLINRTQLMKEQISDVLKYSEIGRVTFEKSEVDLNELIDEITDSIAPSKNIKISIVTTLPTILCEKPRIYQVFQQLIGNSVKYMDKPAGIITIDCDDETGWWKFSVTDNGPGIEEKYFEKIFQIFQTLAVNDKDKGTGMGLAIVKKIVESYNGKIWVESKVGQGSTFAFTLPKQIQQQEAPNNG